VKSAKGRAHRTRRRSPIARIAAAGAVDCTTKILNNLNLADDQRVLKALEQWHPGSIDWWMTMGPDGFQTSDVHLRTAVSIDPEGCALQPRAEVVRSTGANDARMAGMIRDDNKALNMPAVLGASDHSCSGRRRR
jgi:hypothetical protein